MSKTDAVPVFELGSAGTDFKSKSKDIFGVLQTLEDKHSAVESARRKSGSEKDEETFWKNDPIVEPDVVSKDTASHEHTNKLKGSYSNRSSDKGDASNFRKPYFRPPSNRRFNKQIIPDHKIHPEKYTCYSLGDVSSSDMSNTSNSRAAFDFLEERRKFREQQERGSDEEEAKVDVSDTACSRGVFTFKKRNKTDEQSEKKGDKSKDKTVVSLAEEEPEDDEEKQNEKTEEIACFKPRKSKQRNIRVREDAEDEDE
ncbi:protein TSSC4 [Patella vulgata]|uniref:protein TSSC4 n=1 Tax=Patella vulgata TaxID=6465 RepID=UPI0021806DE0|nr:protein TSSC4 [Patella vulgata]